MLTEKLKLYLQNNVDEVLPKYQEEYKDILKQLGFDDVKNASFINFMSKYSDEHYGNIGLIHDVMNDDLSDYENGISKHLKDNYNVPEKYVSLFNLEVDDYLLYNKEDDSVVLIEGGNDIKLKNEKFDQKWSSFNEFLEHFFELN